MRAARGEDPLQAIFREVSVIRPFHRRAPGTTVASLNRVALAGKTILVVDDEYSMVATIADVLEEEGYRVLCAANGAEGLAKLQLEAPDLVLLDVMMPVLDGRSMLERMRSSPSHRTTPVILMSAAIQRGLLERGADRFLAFLHKPFHLSDLLTQAERLLRARSGRH